MPNYNLALISETDQLSFDAVVSAAAAIQRQITEDFGPAWGVAATLAPLKRLLDIQAGYWPIVIRDVLDTNQVGVHLNETADKPFALVAYRQEDWAFTAAHEALEMLADPWSTSYLYGPPPIWTQRLAQYLVEVCDPCQAWDYGYDVNGWWLPDFVLPEYYTGFGPGRYSCLGYIGEPRTLLPGGYVTWRDVDTAIWWQLHAEDSEPVNLGLNPAPPDLHLRGVIDRQTTEYLANRPARKRKRARTARRAPKATDRPADSGAVGQRWRVQIDRILNGEN